MKKIVCILITLTLCVSCKKAPKDNQINYIESTPSFYHLRNGSWLKNEWIRKPRNLLMLHETFKKFGYMNIIPNDLLFDKPLIIRDIYIQKSAYQLLDSLELSYKNAAIKEKYYKEFWKRRETEGNDSIVYLIIKDINYAIKNKKDTTILSRNSNPNLINDTLLQLLKIEYRKKDLTNQVALKDFETLKTFGFHESANNLLFNMYQYQNILWNKDSLASTLIESDQYIAPWFANDTK